MAQPSRTAVLGLYKGLRRQGSRLMVSWLAEKIIQLAHQHAVSSQQPRAVLLIASAKRRTKGSVSPREVLLLLLLGLSLR